MVELEFFTCPGADADAPQCGFEVVGSDLPSVPVGTFLLDSDVANLTRSGCAVKVHDLGNVED
jgi:hypothetical protein